MEPDCIQGPEGEFWDLCQIIDHLPDIFLLVNDKGRIVIANNVLQDILGWTPKEIIGAEVETLLAPEVRNIHQKYRAQFYDKPTTRNMNELVNLSAMHKIGYLIPVDVKLSSMEIKGKAYGVSIVRDATKQRNLQNKLEEKYNLIEKTMAEKNHLLGIAAHDMRNPIGIIQNYAQILLAASIGPLNKDQEEFINRIYQSSLFTMGLLEDMLDFSTIESGTMTLQKEEFAFSGLLEEVLSGNNIYAQTKSIELIINTDFETNLSVFADKRKLHQVLHNLINNAIKYSPERSLININTEIKESNLTFSVEDHGVGIPKDDLENLFAPFYRAKNKPTAGEKSTGLGLFITKRIVEAHNGKLFVNSVDGNGSIFSAYLPIVSKPE